MKESSVCLLSAIICLLPAICQADSFESNRCVCLCSGIGTPRVSQVGAEDCRCNNVAAVPNVTLCALGCECTYQSRNVPLIKIVVVGLLVVIVGLLSYMLFLTVLYPKGSKVTPASTPKRVRSNRSLVTMTSFASETNSQKPIVEPKSPRRQEVEDVSGAAAFSSVGGIRSSIRHEHQRWMKKTQKMREHTYTSSTG